MADIKERPLTHATADQVLAWLTQQDRWGSFTDGPGLNPLRDCIEALAREVMRLKERSDAP